MSQREYRRLPGTGRRGGFFTIALAQTRCSLWLGKDHLLSVDRQGNREEYKRFYYRDIQAVITRRTQRATAQNFFFAIMIVLFGLLILAAGPNGRIVAGILAGATLVFLAINLLRGATCACHLITAVHTEALPSLNRLRTARNVLGQLRPLIEATQGALTPELLQAAAAAPPLIETAPPLTARKGRGPRPLRHENGRIHVALFSGLIATGLCTLVSLLYNNLWVTIVSGFVSTAVMALTIWALIRQIDTDLPVGVRRLAVASMGQVVLSVVMAVSAMVVMVIKHPRLVEGQWEMMRAFAAISPLDSMWLSGLYTVYIVYTLGLGLPGLLLLMNFRRQSPLVVQPPQVPPVPRS